MSLFTRYFRRKDDELPSGSHLVCPRCGEAAAQTPWCSRCGLNLGTQGELPTADAYSAKIREARWVADRGEQPRSPNEGHGTDDVSDAFALHEQLDDRGTLHFNVEAGFKEGPYLITYPGGQVRERGTYARGQFTGVSEGFTPDGRLQFRAHYLSADHAIAEAFYPSGQLEQRWEIHSGLAHAWSGARPPSSGPCVSGSYLQFYEDGNLMARGTHVDWKLDGPFEGYHSGGQLKFRKHFRHGQLHGIGEAFDVSGRLLKRLESEDGRLKRAVVTKPDPKPLSANCARCGEVLATEGVWCSGCADWLNRARVVLATDPQLSRLIEVLAWSYANLSVDRLHEAFADDVRLAFPQVIDDDFTGLYAVKAELSSVFQLTRKRALEAVFRDDEKVWLQWGELEKLRLRNDKWVNGVTFDGDRIFRIEHYYEQSWRRV